MTEVTLATVEVITRVFEPAVQHEVRKLLEERCGVDLPFTETWTSVQLERIRFAVLKLSDGDVARLREHIAQAHTDWRDVLVASGFGDSLESHHEWARSLTR